MNDNAIRHHKDSLIKQAIITLSTHVLTHVTDEEYADNFCDIIVTIRSGPNIHTLKIHELLLHSLPPTFPPY